MLIWLAIQISITDISLKVSSD